MERTQPYGLIPVCVLLIEACAPMASGARVRLTARTTTSPISRMRTSVEMTGGSLADPNYGRCACGSWPRWSSTCYSITWSARSSSDCGIVRPSPFAVFRLTTSSNLVGCSRSSGAPECLRTRDREASNALPVPLQTNEPARSSRSRGTAPCGTRPGARGARHRACSSRRASPGPRPRSESPGPARRAPCAS
jgi:hypothetical protein